MKKAMAALLFGVLFLGIYHSLTKVQVGPCKIASKSVNKDNISLPFSHRSAGLQEITFECRLDSKIAQEAKIGIAMDDLFDRIVLNGKALDLDVITRQYGQRKFKDWKRGYPFYLQLKKGTNHLVVHGSDQGGRFGLRVGQGLSFSGFFLIFVFGVVPIVYGAYVLLFPLVDRALRWRAKFQLRWRQLPYFIIGLGTVLRLFYLVDIPNDMYQHDMIGHIHALEYVAKHPTEIPQPDKSLQFPQQPLYYYAAAAVYTLSKSAGFNDHDAVYAIRVMSFAFSVLWLVAGWFLVRLYTSRVSTINLFLAFLAFTPSFVFLAGAVNNDTLNALLGMLSLYAVSKYYLQPSKKWFLIAASVILLAMLTKISSALYAVFFVMLLLVMYVKRPESRPRLRSEILGFGMTVLLVFGFALTKSYIPANGEFRFVNSSLYGGQVLPPFGLGYFFSFHFFDLISAAQSFVKGIDDVRFSLPTYLYGTFLIGEFDYSKFFVSGTLFRFWSQAVLLLGSLFLVGWAAYLWSYRRLTLLQKLLIVPVAINLVLIVKFLLSFWVVCNSDFRYFTPTFGALGLMAVLGLEQLGVRFARLRPFLYTVAFALAVSETIWIADLIRLT